MCNISETGLLGTIFLKVGCWVKYFLKAGCWMLSGYGAHHFRKCRCYHTPILAVARVYSSARRHLVSGSSYCSYCYPRTATAVYTRLCSVFYLIKDDSIFRFDHPVDRVVRFGPKSDDLGHRILKSDFTRNLTTWAIGFSNQILPVEFCNIGLHEKTDYFFRSKNQYLKLGMGSHYARQGVSDVDVKK